MRLQLLSPGSTTWNEDQSRKNFEAVRQKVVPGNPVASPLLIHPLRYEAGGDQWHGGGAQFTSANEPEWQTIAAWVQGKNAVSEATLTGTRASSLTATGNPVAGAASNTAGLKLRIVQTNMAGDNLHVIDYVTPDGKYVIAASDDQTFTVAVINQKTEEPVRSIKFTNRPRPLAFHTNADGSTKWVLAGRSELHGFVVADFTTGKEIHRIKFPDLGRSAGQNAEGSSGNRKPQPRHRRPARQQGRVGQRQVIQRGPCVLAARS